jgi:flagella basal body P-ring formation protein FlgA
MVASNRIASGARLRRELLRPLVIVQQGQIVKVLTQGRGFMVSTEGRAMTQAAAGALLQVKTPGGAMVSGIVRSDGMVERSP